MPFDHFRSDVAKSSRVGLASCLLIAVLLGLVPSAAGAPPDPLPAGVVFEPNLEYAVIDDQHLQLNLARPRDVEGPFPAVVCIHGGGFRAGSRDSFDQLCVQLAEHGYVAVTVSYRLAPKYQFPAALHDVKAAVRWLRANSAKYHIDPDRIGTTGASAGGTLAQMLGVTGDVAEFEGSDSIGADSIGAGDQPSRVACVVNVYGANDFTRSYEASVDAAEVLPLFLGGNLQEQRQRHIDASPLYWVTPHAAPTLCIHGTRDAYVAYDQSKWLVERLQAAGVAAELMTIADGDHGFRTASPATQADIERRRLAFFDHHLKRQ